MKILIIGDSHGNIANLKHVMGFAKKINIGAVIHTGDWNTLQSIEAVLEYKIPLYVVLGNADIDERIANRLQRIGKTNFNKFFLKFKIDSLKIGLTHNIRNIKENINNYDIVFCGHRHNQGQRGNIINPGALEKTINFAVYDTKTDKIEFFNENKISKTS